MLSAPAMIRARHCAVGKNDLISRGHAALAERSTDVE